MVLLALSLDSAGIIVTMVRTRTLGLMAAMTIPALAQIPSEPAHFLRRYCTACHQGAKPAGGFAVRPLLTLGSFRQNSSGWTRTLGRVRNHEMPPRTAPAPSLELREAFVSWAEGELRQAACAGGIQAAPFPVRRLNRAEYAATIRDLLDVHYNAAHALPADGAGGEGFDNAAETLFLSPLHAEKYLEAARSALEYGAADSKSRARFLRNEPNPETPPDVAARRNLEAFVPRAFRRTARPGEVDRYLKLFLDAQRRGESFDRAMLYSLQAVLVSPYFLFRFEEPNPEPRPRPVPGPALASRLSYFLWGSMPDDELMLLGQTGKLEDDTVLRQQVVRLLKDQKSRGFAEQFVEQWLGTRELGRDIKPDPSLFAAYYDAELQSAIRYEPVLFFQELLAENLSLVNLLDSDFTILTNRLARHYGLQLKDLSQQPKRFALPEGSRRGGLLGMSAVLAVSSLPTRTSPVLRGKWILESLLGAPPPPPPPNVPELAEDHSGASPRTVRARLEQHRRIPACAGCHDRIDPLGFALENYDVLGRWRTEEAGQPVDASGQLLTGEKFQGPTEFKRILIERHQTTILRSLTSRLLGYALGRGLRLEDSCAVDAILAETQKDGYRAQSLITAIVLSPVFRLQPPASPPNTRRVYDRK